MKTLSLRFGENFAPDCGTIAAHQDMINKNGFVWYGKFGNAVSDSIIKTVLEEKNPRILLIKSGSIERYWAYIDTAQRQTPELIFIPEYYRSKAEKVKCWFKITRIEKAPKDVMSRCFIVSSGARLSDMSRVTLNPCIFVEYKEE